MRTCILVWDPHKDEAILQKDRPPFAGDIGLFSVFVLDTILSIKLRLHVGLF